MKIKVRKRSGKGTRTHVPKRKKDSMSSSVLPETEHKVKF